ncbi:MAG TPA: hypothetical protein VGM41_12820 [Chitinophagaceae bacterium]|jgi:hypothetical protein
MEERIKSQLPDSLLVTISLTDNRDSIHWEEEGKEFSFHQQLYDVVRNTYKDKKTWLVCLADEKEEALVDRVCDVTGNNQHNEGKNNTPPVFKIADDFTVTNPPDLAPCYRVAVHTYYAYSARLLKRERVIAVPPPRC